MSVFGTYSRYYDLLYRDKNYQAEANFVLSLINQHCPQAATLLDLGCGTGRHARLFAEAGYQVTGVDRSQEMLDVARAAAKTSKGRLDFAPGDVRDVRLGKQFDVVTSLFHVMSYQNQNLDVNAALATLREHLAPGGIFIFDFWYGPAVLNLKPAVRALRLEDAETAVTRIAEPVMHPNRNVVDVNYQVFVKDTASVSELRETHAMRYFFLPELELFAERNQLRIEHSLAFLSDAALSTETWTGVVIGRRSH
jgi:SAM-dependent methyltransferase